MDDFWAFLVFVGIAILLNGKTILKKFVGSPQKAGTPSTGNGLVTIIIENCNSYKNNPFLIQTIMQYASWDYEKAKVFLNNNPTIQIQNQPIEEASMLLAKLKENDIGINHYEETDTSINIVLEAFQKTPFVKPKPVPVIEPSTPKPTTVTLVEEPTKEAHPMRNLLNSKKRLSQAIVLQEIMGKPLSERGV